MFYLLPKLWPRETHLSAEVNFRRVCQVIVNPIGIDGCPFYSALFEKHVNVLAFEAYDDQHLGRRIPVATQVERIPDVLIPEVIDRIKGLLRDANLEHRDLLVRDLLGDRAAVEEHEIDALMDQIRQRLKAAFAKAKSETGGKKRVRFFLK